MPGDPNDPWGGVQSNATTPNTADPNDPTKTVPTGLSASQNTGHTWGLTDLWGGDNAYGDWKLNPNSYAPQGDSASFYDSLAKQYAGQNAANAQGAFNAANTAWGQYMGNYGQQQQAIQGYQGVLDQLQAAAAGQMPSQAELQMQQGIQQSTSAQQALANSARGGPGAWAAAQRASMNNAAQMQQTGIGQAAALRAQEMATARGQLAQAQQGYGQMLGAYGGQYLGAQQQMGAYGQNFQKQDQATMLALLGYGQSAGALANQQENAWNNVAAGAASANAQNNANATAATAQVGAAALSAL